MSFLDQIPLEEKERIISLPYRVGLWVSQSDVTGGEDAGALELQTLSNIINGFARDVFGAELVQLVMMETIANQNKWPEWDARLDTVLEDCSMAVDVVRSYGDEKETSAFRNHLLEIGRAVAMAFSEYADQDSFGQFLMKLSYCFHKIKGRFAGGRKTSEHEFMSISFKERRALSALAKSLGAND